MSYFFWDLDAIALMGGDWLVVLPILLVTYR